MASFRKMALSWKSWALLFPALLLAGIEVFVDPFPNSLWLLRILNTKYLVHVRADLTVDGEPLVMERTFRCYNPVDYDFLRKHFLQSDLHNDGQVGDSLTAESKTGRLLSIPLPDVCSTFDPSTNNPPVMRMTQGQLEIPLIDEIFGGNMATMIYRYMDRVTLIGEGYHGVRVNELTAQKLETRHQFIDWENWEWYGHPRWSRPDRFNPALLYQASYSFSLTRDQYLKYGGAHPTSRDAVRLFSGLWDVWSGVGTPKGLRLLFKEDQPKRTRLDNLSHLVVPCLPDPDGPSYHCDEGLSGVVVYLPNNTIKYRTDPVTKSTLTFHFPYGDFIHSYGYSLFIDPEIGTITGISQILDPLVGSAR